MYYFRITFCAHLNPKQTDIFRPRQTILNEDDSTCKNDYQNCDAATPKRPGDAVGVRTSAQERAPRGLADTTRARVGGFGSSPKISEVLPWTLRASALIDAAMLSASRGRSSSSCIINRMTRWKSAFVILKLGGQVKTDMYGTNTICPTPVTYLSNALI